MDNYQKYERYRDGYQKEFGIKNEGGGGAYGVKNEKSPRRESNHREFYDRKRSRDYGEEKYE